MAYGSCCSAVQQKINDVAGMAEYQQCFPGSFSILPSQVTFGYLVLSGTYFMWCYRIEGGGEAAARHDLAACSLFHAYPLRISDTCKQLSSQLHGLGLFHFIGASGNCLIGGRGTPPNVWEWCYD